MQVPGLATHCTEPGQRGLPTPPSNTKSRLRHHRPHHRHHHLKELGPFQLLTEAPALLHLQDRKCSSGTFSHQSHLTHTAVMLHPELSWLHRYQGNTVAEGRCRDPEQRLAVVLAMLCCCFSMNKKPVDIRKPQKISLKLQNSTENIVQLRPSAQCTHAYSAS